MILSSMSVTLRQNVTSYPLAVSQRRRMSKLTPDRMCPMCGGAWTVAPHRYSEAFPGTTGYEVAYCARGGVVEAERHAAQAIRSAAWPIRDKRQST